MDKMKRVQELKELRAKLTGQKAKDIITKHINKLYGRS